MTGFRDKIERVRESLDDVPEEAADGVKRVMDGFDGLTVRERWAPDRDDYPETDEGHRQYLHDCHAAAREQLAAVAAELDGDPEAVQQAAEAYPDLGDRSRSAQQAREAVDDTVANTATTLERVHGLCETLARIEDELADRR